MDQERLAFVALHFVPGLGDVLIKQLVSYCGAADAVFHLPKSKLERIPGIGSTTAAAISRADPFRQAEREFRLAEQHEAELLFFFDKHYPQRLKVLDDAPSMIYWHGNINLNAERIVAMVGTREATSYGREQVDAILEELKPYHPVILSGLAYGIDIAAHKGAVKLGLNTVGVLGSGLDIIYPALHRDVAKKMTQQGGLMTEQPFGTAPDAHHFPARNRMIAGLCDALIVVEAANTGGALITAEIANSYNKDIFAVPGKVGDVASEGCNRLIKTHKANLLTTGKDVAYIMNWDLPTPGEPQQLTLALDAFDPQEKKVVGLLASRDKPVQVDELCALLDIHPGLMAPVLLSLELKNVLVGYPGKQYGLRRRSPQA